MDNFQLRQRILNFSLADGPRGNQGYSRVLLQLFGYVGHGKSCFINSCKYVMDEGEHFIPFAVAGERKDGGAMTTVRKSFDLTENITIVDNRGFTKMSSFQRAVIYTQMGNFIPIGETVVWMDNFTDIMHKVEDAGLNPNYSDFIVPILIYSATTSMPNPAQQEMKQFLDDCVKLTGVVPIIVITKKTRGDFIEIEKAFQCMGAENVISIENYTEEDHIKTQGRTKDILTIIHKALEDVRFRLGEKERNPRADWVQRKKFLLEYIYKADREKEREERTKQELMKKMLIRRPEKGPEKEKKSEKEGEENKKKSEKKGEEKKKKSEKECLIC